jgi:hypothetical protein
MMVMMTSFAPFLERLFSGGFQFIQTLIAAMAEK